MKHLAGLTIVLLAASGCGGTSDAQSAFNHPTSANEIVIQISTSGGFAPAEYVLTQIPEFTLYGDGRVIVAGPQIEIYPGPALPNLAEIYLTEQAVQELLAAAEDFGLFDPLDDYGFPGVTDLPGTNFTVNADGSTHTAYAYALGFEDNGGDMSGAQVDARRNLRLFVDEAMDTSRQAGDRYAYAAIAVLATPGASQADDLAQAIAGWPLEPLEAAEPTFGGPLRCVTVTGDELVTLDPLLARANELTPWDDGTDLWRLRLRPLLPHESDCDDLGD